MKIHLKDLIHFSNKYMCPIAIFTVCIITNNLLSQKTIYQNTVICPFLCSNTTAVVVIFITLEECTPKLRLIMPGIIDKLQNKQESGFNGKSCTPLEVCETGLNEATVQFSMGLLSRDYDSCLYNLII